MTVIDNLRLDKTAISDAGLAVLARFNHLKGVSIVKTNTTRAGRRRLGRETGMMISEDPTPMGRL